MKTIFTFFAIFIISHLFSQTVKNGFYYLANPVPNIFGEAFKKPDLKIDPLPSGEPYLDINNSWLKIEASSVVDSSTIDNLKSSSWATVFKNNKTVHLTVVADTVSLITLLPNYWYKLTNSSYYAIQVLRADTVSIYGYIDKSDTIDSKAAEKILLAFTGVKTFINIGLNIFSKDSTNKKGLVHIERHGNDTFKLVAYNVDFAVRYMQPTSEFRKALNHSPDCSNGNFLKEKNYFEDTLSNNTSVDLLQYWTKDNSDCSINLNQFNSVQVREIFSFNTNDNTCSVSLIKKIVGQDTMDLNKQSPFWVDSREIIDDESIHFDNTYPFEAFAENKTRRNSKNYTVLCDYKLDFDPKTKILKVWNYKINYQTDIWTISTDAKFLPDH